MLRAGPSSQGHGAAASRHLQPLHVRHRLPADDERGAVMQAGPAQRTPPPSPVEQVVDNGRFEFAPPAARRRIFVGNPAQEQAGGAGAAAEVTAPEGSLACAAGPSGCLQVIAASQHTEQQAEEQLLDSMQKGGITEQDSAGMPFMKHLSSRSHQSPQRDPWCHLRQPRGVQGWCCCAGPRIQVPHAALQAARTRVCGAACGRPGACRV